MGVIGGSRSVTACLVAGALLAASCGGPSRQYVSNTGEQTYFAIPNDFDLADTTAEENQPDGLTPSWRVLFGEQGYDPAAVGAPTALTGEATVLRLSEQGRDTLSVSSVRSVLFFGVDPVIPSDGLGRLVRLRSNEPVEMDGLSASRVVADLLLKPAEDGASDEWTTVDVTSALDPVNGRLIYLRIICSVDCYDANEAVADDIANSWKVTTP
jgi:hypothetical protein